MKTRMTRDPMVPKTTMLLLVLLLLGGAEAAINVDGNWSPWSSVEGFCVRPDNLQVGMENNGNIPSLLI